VRSYRRNRTVHFGVDVALALTVALVLAGAAIAAAGPTPVSPGGADRAAVVEARCPTFHWAGVPGAGGYELAVFRLSDDDDQTDGGAEPVLVTRASVPGDARGFTPSSADCLERGRRYAWSVAAAVDGMTDAGELQWSPPSLFEVGAAPSLDEVEEAIATLQRYRDSHLGDTPASAATVAAGAAAADGPSADVPVRARQARTAFAAESSALPGALTTPTSGVIRVASAATPPSLGAPSLRVSANVALGPSSNLFKDDEVFLWDDIIAGNTALGRNALASAYLYATNNTAVGRDALRNTSTTLFSGGGAFNSALGDGALRTNTFGKLNTASGFAALYSNTTGDRNTASGSLALRSNTTGPNNTASGFAALYSNTTGSFNTASGYRALGSNTEGSYNTASGHQALFWNTIGTRNAASGDRALFSNTTGAVNTASGYKALFSNTTGTRNTASGYGALHSNTTGSRNTAIGDLAGLYATTGNDNIFVGSGAEGEAGETNTIRIGGTSTGFPELPGPGQQNRTFINGIRLMETYHADAIAVLIDSAGQLGTASSSRAVKQDVQDLGALADRLLELRPVAFRYKQHAARDPDTPLQFGLIAEEVAEVFPELVVFDQEGKAQTVKYHLLSSLLLGEVQRQQAENRRQEAELRHLHTRLDTIEKKVREPSKRHGDRRGRR
jgi:hypothetical protein